MIRYIIHLFFIFAFSVSSSGQAPGYMGKRFMASFDLMSSIVVRGPTAQNKGASPHYLFQNGTTTTEASFALNLNYRINASYIFANNFAVGLNTSFAKTGLCLKYAHQGSATTNAYDHFYTLNYNTIGIDITRSSYLAPIGLYGKLGFGLVTGKGVESNLNVLTDPSFNPASIYTSIKPFPYIQLGLGWKNVLFDRIILDFGFDAAFATIKKVYRNFSSNEFQEHYYLASRARIARHLMINVKVGLGFLIF